MRRLLALAMVLAFLTPSAEVASAQGVATPTPSAQLELGAMTLTPSELDDLGLSGFGLANVSSLRDAETDAVVEADGDVLEVGERLAAYRADGFRYRYVGSMLRPRVPLTRYPSGLVAAESRISTAVTEYTTVEGAEAGFAFVAGGLDDRPGGQDVPDVRAIGDQTDATRSADVELESREPWQRLELAFRLGKLVASVDVIDYRNVEPELAVAELLAEALLTKIERVQAEGTPGLSPRALRLAPLASWIEANRLRDFYVRVGGRDEPTFAQMVAALRDGGTAPTGTPAPSRGFVRPSDTYMFWTPVGEGDPLELPLYVVWLDRHASSQQAASAVRALSSDLGSGYFDVQEFLSAEHIGDESREFAYRFEGDASGAARGYLVVAQVGEFVVRTQVDGPRGVQAVGVRELAAVQVACLLQEGACAPMSHLVASAALVAEPGAR